MALVSDLLKQCGVKIKTTISGVPNYGSGVVYVTPLNCKYNYVLTAKHIFQEDSQTQYEASKIFNIEILYSSAGILKNLEHISKKEITEKLITFEEDFAIICIEKNNTILFPLITVSDTLGDDDKTFFSWSIFSANKDELQKFDLRRNDAEMKRFKLDGNLNGKFLPGMSGAGVFVDSKPTLLGVINKYPNEAFQNETIDCTNITFHDINRKLKSIGKAILDTEDSLHKKEINNRVVDIHQTFINGACLNLDLAVKRLKTDMCDDWYHDPLKYIDLLNNNFLFDQLGEFFGTDNYIASEAERFYVPKKKLTLREALILPFTDRIIYMATVGALAERIESSMIPKVYSARYNKYSSNSLIVNGVEQWKKMQYKLAECATGRDELNNYKYGCVIEIDLLNFYDNINKKLLYEKLKRICETTNEQYAAALLYKLICRFSEKEMGLPQNSDASSLLASFYLNQVDIFMQHHSFSYFRFMDDIRIFCKDKYEARKILQTFEFELRRCHLSVNSQKTEIFTLVENGNSTASEQVKIREEYNNLFDMDINKIARLRSSKNYAYRNQAFHLSVELLGKYVKDVDTNNPDESSRKLNYALNTIAILGINNLNIYSESTEFIKHLESAITNLLDKPWITSQVTNILNLIPGKFIEENFLPILKSIVLDERYNTYSFQTYQIWLLLAKHKCNSFDLKNYAVKQIEKNDSTNRAVIAAMIIYVCSVDSGYRRVILRKFAEGFAQGYFQNRISLISLRSFPTDIINSSKITPTLNYSIDYTHRFKNKDLVFVQGFDENEETSDLFEQLYSI